MSAGCCVLDVAVKSCLYVAVFIRLSTRRGAATSSACIDGEVQLAVRQGYYHGYQVAGKAWEGAHLR